MTKPLKLCPFCNGSAKFSGEDGAYYCQDCGCMPFVDPSIHDPVDTWNSRAEPIGNSEELPEWLWAKIQVRIMIRNQEVMSPVEHALNDELKWVLSLKKDNS